MEKNYTLTIPRIMEQVVDLGRTAWNAQKHSELVSARKKKEKKSLPNCVNFSCLRILSGKKINKMILKSPCFKEES